MSDLNFKSFIQKASQFHLGNLTTESLHPKTQDLSHLVKNDLSRAVDLLYEIDQDALHILKTKLKDIYRLNQEIQKTIESQGRIFLCGCGATGRLSIAIETLYRQQFQNDDVLGFMAGGDYALIKSVESFEDMEQYGIRQTKELGFTDNDLMIGITEGGETTFVIAATEYAQKNSKRAPYFLYCNPDDEFKTIERSMRVIHSEGINKLNLTIGPMALAGSTRMQASTIQMLAMAFALFIKDQSEQEFIQEARRIIKTLSSLNLIGLDQFVKKESEIYKNKEIVTYFTDKYSAMTILTDTTERSPTFSLMPFEKLDEEHHSLAYIALNGTESISEAWNTLLSRKPRCLSWKDLPIKIDVEELFKFDISQKAIERRNKKFVNHVFNVKSVESGFHFELGGCELKVFHEKISKVFQEIALKMVINIHSTLIMGLLGRYERNIMTYVKPSNLKLIDRAMRYCKELLGEKALEYSDEEIIRCIFDEMPHLQNNEAIVLKVVKKLS